MNSKRSSLFVCALIAVVMLWPASAAAQRGHGGGHGGGPHGGGTHVSIGVGYGYGHGYGYYSPFYNPFFFGVGFGWYSGYGWYGRYPGWYGYAPYYGYPYGYYGWASARIEVQPRAAQVFIDGYYAGIVDNFDGTFQRLDVPPGAHELAIYMPGYRTMRERTMFRPGAGYHFKGALEPLPAGTPPEPQPAPAPRAQGPDPNRAYRNGPPQGYGQPPDQGYGPPPNQGYGAPGEEGRTVPLPERRQAPRQPRQPQSSDFGTLALRVQPSDAVVTIDGERWDSPGAGSRLLVQLAGGQHRLEVHKDGYKPYSTSVEIRPGETQDLNISLPPM